MSVEGSLRIGSTQASDAGRYYCVASNPAGSDHRGMDLRVFGTQNSKSPYSLVDMDTVCKGSVFFTLSFLSPITKVGPSIGPGPFNVTMTTGVRAVLSCETIGVPPPKVSWRRNGTPIDLSQQSGAYRYSWSHFMGSEKDPEYVFSGFCWFCASLMIL